MGKVLIDRQKHELKASPKEKDLGYADELTDLKNALNKLRKMSTFMPKIVKNLLVWKSASIAAFKALFLRFLTLKLIGSRMGNDLKAEGFTVR